jgi:uncharacterized membrane-anchored protein
MSPVFLLSAREKRMRSLPKIDTRYWLALSAASIFGTNTGDFVAGYLHLGHLAGLPWLLAAFAVILLLERVSPVKTPLWFWAAIITMRTAATNVGDAFHDFGLGFGISVPLMLVLFAASVAFYARLTPARAAGEDTVKVNAIYWIAMMLAGVLGTVGGDLVAKWLTNPGAALVVFAIAAVAIVQYRRRGMLLAAVPYWICVGLIRTAGTAGGDTVAHTIGLAPSTALTGVVFLALIIASSRSVAVIPATAAR